MQTAGESRNPGGDREILGIDASSEDGAGWLAVPAGLTARGLSGVALVTSDDHAGLVHAIAALLPGDAWQRLAGRVAGARCRSEPCVRSVPAHGSSKPRGRRWLKCRVPALAGLRLVLAGCVFHAGLVIAGGPGLPWWTRRLAAIALRVTHSHHRSHCSGQIIRGQSSGCAFVCDGTVITSVWVRPSRFFVWHRPLEATQATAKATSAKSRSPSTIPRRFG